MNTEENKEIEISPDTKFSFDFTLNEIYLIGTGLGKLPFETASPIITRIQADIAEKIKTLIK